MRVRLVVALIVLLGAARGIYLVTNQGSTVPISFTDDSIISAPGSRYLASGSDFAGFIQWSDQLGHLSGSLRWVDISGTPPNEQVLGISIPLHGSIQRSSISVSFQGGSDSSTTLSDGSFVINVVWPDRIAAPLSFHSASMQSFNFVAGQLRTIANDANWLYIRALRREQERQAGNTLLIEKEAIDHDASSVESDMANLAKIELTLQNSKQWIVGRSTSRRRITVGAVEADDPVAESKAVTRVNNGVDAIRQAITSLASDFGIFQSDESDLPNFVPPGAPTEQLVMNAEATGEQIIAAAIAITSSTSP